MFEPRRAFGEEWGVYTARVFEWAVRFDASGGCARAREREDDGGGEQRVGDDERRVDDAGGRGARDVVDLLAELEARLDFDDEMVPLDVNAVEAKALSAREKIREVLATAKRGALLETGVTGGHRRKTKRG